MSRMKCFLVVSGLASLLIVQSSVIAATHYPLTLENCYTSVTFEKAPERAIGLGQNRAEIMLLLGLEDRMVGTAI